VILSILQITDHYVHHPFLLPIAGNLENLPIMGIVDPYVLPHQFPRQVAKIPLLLLSHQIGVQSVLQQACKLHHLPQSRQVAKIPLLLLTHQIGVQSARQQAYKLHHLPQSKDLIHPKDVEDLMKLQILKTKDPCVPKNQKKIADHF
jgi:hypothetical protein